MDAPSKRPECRCIRTKIPYPPESNTGVQISGPPPMKHQKAIPSKLVFHIYRKQHSLMSSTMGQLITGAFFFGVWSCEYYTNLKAENKRTRILRNIDSRFYIKLRKLIYSSGWIHLADKVYPTFRTHNNDVNNAKMTQCKTGKHLYLVQLWSGIITGLD